MAHDAPPRGSPKPGGVSRNSETPTAAGNIIDENDIEEDLEDLGSIDELLAETDQGWDIDAQVLTLKQAAGTRPLAEQSSPGVVRAKMPSRSVSIPTPYELAPNATGRSAVPTPDPSPVPSVLTRSRVPSKAPPPLPRKPSMSVPTPAPRGAEPSPVRLPADMSQADALVDLLNARVSWRSRARPSWVTTGARRRTRRPR
jgi:hypothetical protein